MLKVYKLIDSTDHKTLEKLILLDRLVRFYARFLTHYKAAGVYCDGETVRVKFMTVNRYGYENFTVREFPTSALDERITSYREKIKHEYVTRHHNPRIQRIKEVYKWKKYIDDAKTQV